MNGSEKNSSTVKKPSSNKDWLVHFHHAIKYTRWLLRILGIWHLIVTKPIKIEKYLSKLILPFVSIALIATALPIACHIFLRPLDRFETTASLAPLVGLFANMLIYLTMIIRSDILKFCLQHMKVDWQKITDSYAHRIMTDQVRFSHTLTIACIAFMYSGAFSYCFLIPIISGNIINEMNETLKPRPFPGADIFFDVEANVVYEVVYISNILAAMFHCTITTAVCNLAVVMVSHACGQIQIILWNLENFVDEIINNNQPADVIMKRIGFTVQKHVRVLNFAAYIEKALTEIFLIVVVSSTLVMCFIEYNIIITMDQDKANRVEMVTWIILLTSFAFNVLLYCQFGEILKERCLEVAKVAYTIDWYRLPAKTQLAFVMIIKMGDYPCNLTAGGIMELSIANFASITKTSLAYLNMIRTTMG